MRFFKYLTEGGGKFSYGGSTWSDWIKLFRRNKKEAEKIKKQVLKDLKLERNKDPMTKYAGVGKSFDKFVTQDKKFRIEMVGSVWRIWYEDRGKYLEGQYKTLEKAKDALVSFLMKNDMIYFQVPKGMVKVKDMKKQR